MPGIIRCSKSTRAIPSGDPDHQDRAEEPDVRVCSACARRGSGFRRPADGARKTRRSGRGARQDGPSGAFPGRFVGRPGSHSRVRNTSAGQAEHRPGGRLERAPQSVPGWRTDAHLLALAAVAAPNSLPASAGTSGTVIGLHDTELIDMSTSYGVPGLRVMSTETAFGAIQPAQLGGCRAASLSMTTGGS